MNYQIMPYTYIQRATAMHAALRGVRITAIPSSAASANAGDDFYKNPTRITEKEFRYPVNATATLKGFDEERFNKGDVFRSASEICEMFLVPKRFGETDTSGGTGSASDHDYGKAKPTMGLVYNKMVEWWNGQPGDAADAFEATGDNTRESPYAQLYPRLCTRSNVFQVHYRVQLIRKSRSTSVDAVDLTKDQITAEYRGSTTIERYLDPNDKEIPDIAATGEHHAGARRSLPLPDHQPAAIHAVNTASHQSPLSLKPPGFLAGRGALCTGDHFVCAARTHRRAARGAALVAKRAAPGGRGAHRAACGGALSGEDVG